MIYLTTIRIYLWFFEHFVSLKCAGERTFGPIIWLIDFLLIFLYHVSKADHDVVDVCISVNEKYVAIDRNNRRNIHPIVTSEEKNALGNYLSIAEYLDFPSTLNSLNKSFWTAVQSEPKWVNVHFSVKRYNEAILRCVSICSVRQDVIFVLLIIMINSYFFGWSFLRQEHRQWKLDFDFDRRVEILCEIRDNVILFTWNFIIEIESKLKGKEAFFNLDANWTCI